MRAVGPAHVKNSKIWPTHAIKTIRQYMEKKLEELKVSTQERAKNVQGVLAEKALENHFCPSCGKDFILK